MVTVTAEAAVLTALIVHIQLLVAVIVIFIAAAVVNLIGRMFHFLMGFVAPAVFPSSAHAFSSFHCAAGIVATCQPIPSKAVARS